MGSKICSTCNEVKNYEDFNKRKASKDGLQPLCRECENKKKKERHERNPELKRISDKKYREKNLEKCRDISREWRKRNPNAKKEWETENAEHVKRYAKNYRLRNKNERMIKSKEWRLKNPNYYSNYLKTERGRETQYRKNLKRRSFKNHVLFKPHNRKELLDRDNWSCQICGIKVHDEKRNTPDKAHIDHILPISKGGNSEPDNLQVLCRTCNLSKSDKIVL